MLTLVMTNVTSELGNLTKVCGMQQLCSCRKKCQWFTAIVDGNGQDLKKCYRKL